MNNIFFPYQNQNPNTLKTSPYPLKEFQSCNPVNVNYFIFQEPMGDKAINGLRNIFNFNNSNIISQNHLIIADKGEQIDINKKNLSSNKVKSGKKQLAEITYKKEELEERMSERILAQVSTKIETYPNEIYSPKNQAPPFAQVFDQSIDQIEKKKSIYHLQQIDKNSGRKSK